MNGEPQTTIPFRNAHISPARNPHGELIGVEIRCLYTHDEIAELPDEVLDAAYAVLDQAVKVKP